MFVFLSRMTVHLFPGNPEVPHTSLGILRCRLGPQGGDSHSRRRVVAPVGVLGRPLRRAPVGSKRLSCRREIIPRVHCEYIRLETFCHVVPLPSHFPVLPVGLSPISPT